MWPKRTARGFALLAVVLSCSAALSACDATFTDLRDLPGDLGEPDAGSMIATMDPDAGTNTSTNTPPPPSERVLARGIWEGRAGHRGEGSVELVEFANGSLELRMGADFLVSGVPGPLVILSTRDALGRNLVDGDDLQLGRLINSSGAQNYSVPILDDGRRVAWVFCKPYGVEVARALLSEVE
jgi:hypothetical protein